MNARLSTVIDSLEHLPPGPGDTEAPHGRCKHCDRHLPPPAARGRRRDYCPPGEGRDCREEAKRARQAAADAVIAAPQREIAALFDRQLPQLQALQAFLGQVLDQVNDLQTGVLTRIGEVEADAADARADAAEARAAARAAEEERDQALATAKEQVAEARRLAREAREARDQAVRERNQAQEEAARQITEAAARVREATERGAEQERLRGQAEGERDSALSARQEITTRLATAELEWKQQRQTLEGKLEERRAASSAAAEELVRVKSELTGAHDRAEAAQNTAAQNATSAQTANRMAEVAQTALQQARLDLAAAHGEVKTAQALLIKAETDLSNARADAHIQRERAATAEHRYADLLASPAAAVATES